MGWNDHYVDVDKDEKETMNLQDLIELEKKANKAPWVLNHFGKVESASGSQRVASMNGREEKVENNGNLICELRNAFPFMVVEIEMLREKMKEIHGGFLNEDYEPECICQEIASRALTKSKEIWGEK